jgi:hypothetical protein
MLSRKLSVKYFSELVEKYEVPCLPHLMGYEANICHERHGVISLLISSQLLSVEDNEELLRFAFIHYAAVGFINESLAEILSLESESVDTLTAEDMHCIVLNSSTGELLAYCTIKRPLPYVGLMGDLSRPEHGAEAAWGRGAFEAISWLNYLPVVNVREVGRVVRNAWLDKHDPLASRSVSELLVATFEYLQAPESDVLAIIGDGEINVQIRNLLAFGVDYHFGHVTFNHLPQDHLYYPRYFAKGLIPFAFRLCDMDCSALAWFNQALELDDRSWAAVRKDRMNQISDKLLLLTKELTPA